VLTEEDFDKFRQFRVKAMGDRLREMLEDPSYDEWTFEQKMKELIDAEDAARQSRKIAKLVREARFKLPGACVEGILYVPGRNLNRDRVTRWASCKWVEDKEVVVIISKSGAGKSYLCQALGNSACRKLIKTRYVRLADLLDDLGRCRAAADGSIYEHMDYYKNVDLLIVDDFLTTPITTQASFDVFEIMEARDGRCATLIASQLEPNEWYLRFDSELVADSTINRIATASRFIDLEGPNMRDYLARQRAKDADQA